jgi:hypothetical protein
MSAVIRLDLTRSDIGRVSFGAVHSKFGNLPYIAGERVWSKQPDPDP